MQIDKALRDFLRDEGIFYEVFDVIRLVEQDGHYVCKAQDNGCCQITDECCSSVWGRTQRCANCVSQRAYEENRQQVKFECVNDHFYFVIARPVVIADKKYALEMVIDVTNQFTQSMPSEGNFVMNLIGEIERISARDAFSGLYNKNRLRQMITTALASCAEDKRKLYLAIWDIDNFKKVNDTYGHAAGDRLLLSVSKSLSRGICADEGVVARFGGDEFAVLFKIDSEERCQELLDQIRDDIMQREHQLIDGEKSHAVQIGISYGLAEVSGAATTDEALGMADEELYKKKRLVHMHD